MTYMVTYKAKTSEYFSSKTSEYFSCVLVEADDEISAKSRFKLLKPDFEFVGIKEESHPDTYIQRGMTVLNKNWIDTIMENIDKVILNDEVNSGAFIMIAKINNSNELNVLKLSCGVENADELKEPNPEFPFFVVLEFNRARLDCNKYELKAVEHIEYIDDLDYSEIARYYQNSQNRVNDIEQLIWGDKCYNFEEKILQIIYAFSDNKPAQSQVLNRLAYNIRHGKTKGNLSKHGNVRFDVDGILNDHTLLNAYKHYFPATGYTFMVKCWETKNDRDEGCSKTYSFPDLLTAINTGLNFIKENESVEIVAASDCFDEECTILYIGPDDINQDGYGLGSMIVAEFQYIESMKAKGFLPADY